MPATETYRYYITEDGKTEVPAILALTWASGSGTLEEVAAAAKNTGSLRFCYGISEQQYADQSAQGKRLASNIATITVVHAAKAEDPWVNPFRDVTESDWFYDDVRFANQSGLFNGVEKDLFAPEEPMTRGMLVTVLWRLDGETAPEDRDDLHRCGRQRLLCRRSRMGRRVRRCQRHRRQQVRPGGAM